MGGYRSVGGTAPLRRNGMAVRHRVYCKPGRTALPGGKHMTIWVAIDIDGQGTRQ
jgi:hypothetical protein